MIRVRDCACAKCRASVETPLTHPPIPPNCDLLRQSGGLLFVLHSRMNPPYNGREWALADEGPVKRVAAAVARCAWLDEAVTRINGPKRAALIAQGLGLPEREAVQDNYTEHCERHAEQWRKRGNGEKWE